MGAEQLFVGGVFAAGVLSFFAPCIVPLLPAYVAYLSASGASVGAGTGVGAGAAAGTGTSTGVGTSTGTGATAGAGTPAAPGAQAPGNAPQRTVRIGPVRLRPVLLARTLLFVLGLSAVFVTLGFGSSSLGAFVTNSTFIAVCGAIVIGFGIAQTGLVKLPFLEKERRLTLRRTDRGGYFGAFLLGLTFSFGWTPCIGPVLAAILGIAAGAGTPAFGAWLMFVYTMGLSLPFLAVAVFSDILVVRIRRMSKYAGAIKVVSGSLLIVMGVLLMTNQLNAIAVWVERL